MRVSKGRCACLKITAMHKTREECRMAVNMAVIIIIIIIT